MANTMKTQQFNQQQLSGPENLNEAIQLLAAKLQHDRFGMQGLQIVFGTLQQLSQQNQALALNLQFNGFVIQKLVEKAMAGEIDENFDFEAFIAEVQAEFEELLSNAEENAQ